MIDIILSKLNFADVGILAGAVLLVIIISYFRGLTTKRWMKFSLELLKECKDVQVAVEKEGYQKYQRDQQDYENSVYFDG